MVSKENKNVVIGSTEKKNIYITTNHQVESMWTKTKLWLYLQLNYVTMQIYVTFYVNYAILY